jgi:site-specific DNA-methyltransferase (adenine-specific)
MLEAVSDTGSVDFVQQREGENVLKMNELYNMDCMEGMKQFPDKYFELAIVDPPYGIGMDGGKIGGDNCGRAKNYTKKAWDIKPPDKAYISELQRVSKNQIVFGANHFISIIPYDSPCWVVWDKDNTGNFADCELAWTSFKSAVRKFTYRWNGMLQGDMKNKETRVHPTQKPVALYKWLLTNYAKQGDKILDTHVGSASSLIACHNYGFDYIGFEIDEDYYKAAKERLEAVKNQVSMFTN